MSDCDFEVSPDLRAELDTLRTWLGTVIGDPVECARPLPTPGESMERTTTGALFVSRDTGEVEFTDGFRRWTAGPDGLRFWRSPDAVGQTVDQLPLSRAVRCPVLYAHEVPSQNSLRSLLSALLAAGYQPTSLAAVDRAMSGSADVPPGCLVLSFDDALYSQYANALPVLAALKVPAVFFAMPAFNDGVHRYMAAAELRSLYLSGHEIGAHTCNHANLPRLRVSRPIAFLAELDDCKRMLEAISGAPVTYFAYPNGSFDAQVAEAVATAGYRAAFTTRPGAVLSPSSAYALPRIRIDVGESPASVVRRIKSAGG